MRRAAVMGKQMLLTQLTIYYSICITILYGHILEPSSTNHLIQSRAVKNRPLFKHLHYAIKTDAGKSDLKGFIDMSDPMGPIKTVNGEHTDTLDNDNEAITDNGNQRQVINTPEIPRRAFLQSNKIIDSGNQPEPNKRPHMRLMYQKSDASNSNIENIQPQAANGHQSQKLSRRKRGFRSAVADRIAHGFGKRTPLLSLDDPGLAGPPNTLSKSEIETIRNAIGQPAFQMTKQFLSLQPVAYEDTNVSTEELLRKLLALHENRYMSTVEENDDADTALTSIYQKLIS